MARKATVTKEMLLETAFSIVRRVGIREVTARKLAMKANCSTQPIFRIYKNMEELLAELNEKMAAYFETFYLSYPKTLNLPFVNLGMAYIAFARKEKYLFQALFLAEDRQGKSLYELLNGEQGNVLKEITHAKELGVENASELFMKMWIFIHGAACMVITGDYDLEDTETVQLLSESFQSFQKTEK